MVMALWVDVRECVYGYGIMALMGGFKEFGL